MPAVLTNDEQFLIELTNRMRMDPHGEVQRILNASDPDVKEALGFFNVNISMLEQEFAALTPTPPLAWDPRLYAAATGHSQEMIDFDQQSHQLPGEPDLGTRVSNQNYDWNFVGENIFAFATSVFDAHAAFAIDWGDGTGGMEDGRGHRANIMDPDFREVGFSILTHTPPTQNDVGPVLVTEDFGNRFDFGDPWLLGVVVDDVNHTGFYVPGEGLSGVSVNAVQVGGTFNASTQTIATGAYQMQLPAGTYTVTFSGGSLAAPVVKTVTIGSDNVEQDVGYDLTPPTAQFALASTQGPETTSTVNVAVNLSNVFNQTVTVDYAVTGGTAAGGGVNYFLPSGTLTFLPGQTTQFIPLRIFNDGLSDANKTVEIMLSNPTNSTLGTDTNFTYTIINNHPLPAVSFQAALAGGQEGATPAVLPVRLSAAADRAVAVSYAVTGGTAVNGVDYNLASGTLTFNPHQTVQNLSIPILDDGLNKPNETIRVTLSSPTNAVLGLIPTETYVIVNENPPPSVGFDETTSSGDETVTAPAVTVSLSQASGKTVKVSYMAVGGTAVPGVAYTLPSGTLTFAPGQTSQTIPLLTVKDDGRFGPNETVRIALFAPVNATLGNNVVHTYTITESDPAPTVSFSATNPLQGSQTTGVVKMAVTLSAAAAVPVSVDYAVAGGTAVNGGIDFVLPNGTLTFLPGQTSKTISLTVVPDSRVGGDKTIDVTLSNPVNATLGTSTTDTYTLLNSGTGDNPDPRPSVSFDLTTSSGDETVTAPGITVSLSAASSNTVKVSYVVVSGTALRGVDYTLPAGTLTFAPGQTSQTIPLFAVKDDGLYEANGTVRIALFAPVNAVLGNNVFHTYTITESDSEPTVSFAVAAASGSESTTLVRLTVSLSAAAGLPVSVDYSVTGGTALNGGVDFNLRNGTLTFLPGQISRGIAFTVTNDLRNEDNETLAVTLSNPVNATLGANPKEAYTILENDPLPTVRFRFAASSGDEGASPAVVAVVLSAPSGKTVTVDYAVRTGPAGGTAVPNTNYMLQSGTLTFAPGETVQYIPITVLDDGVNTRNLTIGIALSNPTNAVLAAANTTTTFTILNNEPPPLVNFNVAAASGGLGVSLVTIEVDLTAASGQTVTVNYAAIGGTTQGNGVDYTLAPGTLTFAPGVTSQTFQLVVVNDTATDPTETVLIGLSSPLHAVLGPGSIFSYSILGNA